jgi:hypothetical protein
MASQELNIFLMNKGGLCWSKVAAYDQWHERMIGRLAHRKSIFSYNKMEQDCTKQIQHGGIGICSTDEGVHRVINTG